MRRVLLLLLGIRLVVLRVLVLRVLQDVSHLLFETRMHPVIVAHGWWQVRQVLLMLLMLLMLVNVAALLPRSPLALC